MLKKDRYLLGLFLLAVFFSFTQNAITSKPDTITLRASSADAETQIKQLIEQAHVFNAESQRDKALTNYLRALSIENLLQENSPLKISLHRELSVQLMSLQAPSLAVRHAKKALEICERNAVATGKMDTLEIYLMLGHIGGIYLTAENYDSSFIYFGKALHTANLFNNGAQSAAQNNLGIWHFKTGNYDSAAYYFNSALLLQKSGTNYDDGLKYSIQDNLAQLCLKTGKTNEALSIFQQNLQLAFRINATKKQLQSLASIAHALLQENKTKEANNYLVKLEQALDTNNHPYTREWKEKLLVLKLNYFIATGNTREALQYQQKLLEFRDYKEKENRQLLDNLYASFIASRIDRYQKGYALNRLQLLRQSEELKLMQAKNKYNFLLILFISSLSGTIIIFLAVTIKRRLRAHRREQELMNTRNRLVVAELKNKELESEKLKRELDIKAASLSDLSIYLNLLCNQNEDLLEELSRARKLSPDEQQESLKSIALQLQLQSQADQTTTVLLKNIDVLNKEFYTKISDRFPGLSRTEKELCGMLKLNMSSSEIAAVKNIAPGSVKMSRHRLRKKLGLSAEDDIYVFIQQI